MSLTPELSRRVTDILGADLADRVKDASQDPSGMIYVRLAFIHDYEAYRQVNAEMLERLEPYGVEYKAGFYKFNLGSVVAEARPSDQQELRFVDGAGAPVNIPETPEPYAGRPVETGIPTIDGKHADIGEPVDAVATAKALAYGDIHVNPEYEALLPKQSLDDHERLKANVKRDGLWYPVTVNPDGVILDGHNRFKACKEAVVPLRWAVKRFDDPLLEKKFVIEVNLNRRHLNDAQKTQLGIPLLAIEEELARRRMSAGGQIGGQLAGRGRPLEDRGKAELPTPMDRGKAGLPTPIARGQSRDIVAEKVGVKPRIFEYAKTVLERGTQELKDKMLSGQVSVSKAYGTLTAKPRALDLSKRDTSCPVCNRPISQSLYERLKAKWNENVEGLFP